MASSQKSNKLIDYTFNRAVKKLVMKIDTLQQQCCFDNK